MVLLVSRGLGWIAGLWLAGLCAPAIAGEGPDTAAPLDRALASAEDRLRAGDLQAAEGRYREALFVGWQLTVTLQKLERRLPEARDALRNGALLRIETPQGLQALLAAQLLLVYVAAPREMLTA